MRHVQFHYRCVIFGWDYECAASPEWIQQMGVDNLNRKHHQPFYNVMVDDGSIRYAAQGRWLTFSNYQNIYCTRIN